MKKLLYFLLLHSLFSSLVVESGYAQPLKRRTVIEDFTGTWCKWCTTVDTVIEVARAELGDSLVVLKWHFDDELSIDEGRQLSEDFLVASYPSGLINRHILLTNDPESSNIAWIENAREDAGKDPLLSINILDYSLKDYSHRFRVWIERLLPADQMPSGDTSEYVVLAVITEDSIVRPQKGVDDNYILNYVHNDVVRATPMHHLGEPIILSVDGSFNRYFEIQHDLNWNERKLKIKAFIAIRSKVTNQFYVLNATQTDYLTIPPSTVEEEHEQNIRFDVTNTGNRNMSLHYRNSLGGLTTITLHNILGKEIAVLYNGSETERTLELNGMGLRPGTYFAWLVASNGSIVRPFQISR